MNRITNIFRSLLASLVFGILASATAIAVSTSDTRNSDPVKPRFQAMNLACRVSLTPHRGSGTYDKEIIRSQGYINQGRQVEIYLERLGWSYVAKARSDFDPGYYNLARQTAICLGKRFPDNMQAMLLDGHVAHQLHQFRAAEARGRFLVDARGMWFDYGLLGDALLEQGALEDAAAAYQQMLDRHPGPQSYSRAAQLRWVRGDLEGAIELMRMTVRSMSHRDPAQLAWALVQLANWEWQSNQASVARLLVDRALQIQKNHAPALLLRGRMWIAKGRYRDAIADLAQAVETSPLPAYQWPYWEALNAAGATQRADEVRHAIRSQGASLDRRTTALFLLSVGRPGKNAHQLVVDEMAVRQDVFTVDALAWAQRNRGDLEQAWKTMKMALGEGTRDARFYYHTVVIAGESGRLEQCREYLQKLEDLQHLLYPSEQQFLLNFLAGSNPRNGGPDQNSSDPGRFLHSQGDNHVSIKNQGTFWHCVYNCNVVIHTASSGIQSYGRTADHSG